MARRKHGVRRVSREIEGGRPVVISILRRYNTGDYESLLGGACMTAYAYFEGRLVPVEEAKVGIMTHALHYGTACFEGIRAYWNEEHAQLYVLKLVEHYRRMEKSARILRMKLPHAPEELAEITMELLALNKYREDVYIRPLAYKASQVIGVRLHGLDDGFLIYTAPFGKYLEIEKGVRCMVSSWRRVDDNASPARAKISGAY